MVYANCFAVRETPVIVFVPVRGNPVGTFLLFCLIDFISMCLRELKGWADETRGELKHKEELPMFLIFLLT